MSKQKTLKQLQSEKEEIEIQLTQEQHKLERLESRIKFLEKGERAKRTHRLCNLGGAVESLAPEIKEFTRVEMLGLMEYIFSLPEVKCAVHNTALLHDEQFEKKEETQNGIVSYERDAD